VIHLTSKLRVKNFKPETVPAEIFFYIYFWRPMDHLFIINGLAENPLHNRTFSQIPIHFQLDRSAPKAAPIAIVNPAGVW
jgi:hypothetical protein